MELKEALKQLALARQDEESLTTRLSEAQRCLESTEEWLALAALKQSMVAAKTITGTGVELVKKAAIEVFETTGEKKPADGVQIKLFKHVGYDEATAIVWCRKNAPAFIEERLSKAFEKAAETLPGAPVEVTYESRPQIASDLSMYLLIESQTT